MLRLARRWAWLVGMMSVPPASEGVAAVVVRASTYGRTIAALGRDVNLVAGLAGSSLLTGASGTFECSD